LSIRRYTGTQIICSGSRSVPGRPVAGNAASISSSGRWTARPRTRRRPWSWHPPADDQPCRAGDRRWGLGQAAMGRTWNSKRPASATRTPATL